MTDDAHSHGSAEQMRLTIIGPPGSGKSTQAGLLCQRLGLKHICMGDLLRREAAVDSPFAERIRAKLSRGLLVPEDIVLAVLKRELGDALDGFVIDGLPRTLEQALDLESILAQHGQSLDAAVYLQLSNEQILRRLQARGRPDDRPSVILKRIEVFHELADPMLVYYESRSILIRVSGEGDPTQINMDILSRLEQHVGRPLTRAA